MHSSCRRVRHTLLALFCSLPALAEQPPVVAPPADAPPAVPEERINVTGKQLTDTDKRRHESASKITFGREEIARFGDSNLGDVLKRLPGVTVSGTPGRRGGEIRMRGLGSGYTQILVNGERVARGFSLDSLSPELIERIEVMRAPLAEFSAQAVAGTINIVLRDDARKRNSELKLAESITDNHKLQPRLSLQHSDHAGQLSYTLAGTVQHYDQLEASSQGWQRLYDEQAQLQSARFTEQQRRSRGYSLNLAPRLGWHFGDGDSLNLQLFATHAQDVDRGLEQILQPLGQAPFDRATARSDSRSDMLRGTVNRQMPLADGGKLDLRLGFNLNRMGNTDVRLERQADRADRTVVDSSATRDRGLTSGGKWSTGLGEGHSLAMGYELDWSRRSEARTQLGVRDTTEQDPASNTEATTLRLAGYGQDEWDISPQWSLYGGLRWESIRTRSSAQDFQLNARSAVWSPSLQAVWRLPDHKRDQLRFSLARSYKAPRTAELLARTVRSTDNGQFDPDRSGNPQLKPELAWSLEIGFEHYLSQSGLISANLFNRRIDNLIRSQNTRQADGRWLSRPVNLDHANASGIELEAKFRLAELLDDAPPLDVRANASRYWSAVSGIPGPDNRLDGQAGYSVNLGLDYRFKQVPLTVGGNLGWVPGYATQVSESERHTLSGKRVGDIYALWKFSPAVQLRLSASNLAHADLRSGSEIWSEGRYSASNQASRSWTSWTAALELKY